MADNDSPLPSASENNLGADRIEQGLFGLARDANHAAAIIRPWFDQDYYLNTYPDVRQSGMDPAIHYVTVGWIELRDPSPDFSTRKYLIDHPHLTLLGLNPYLHYLVIEKFQGGSEAADPAIDDIPPSSETMPVSQEDEPEPLSGADRKVRSTIESEFDRDYYLNKYNDVHGSGMDPLDHYLISGWKEGRDPTPHFSTEYYLDTNPDVLASGLNPFFHYINSGKSEGRSPSRPGGFRALIVDKLVSLTEKVAAWRGGWPEPSPSDFVSIPQLTELLLEAVDFGRKNMVISISHDDYRNVIGGIQFCLTLEQHAFLADGFVYLNLHPYQPLPVLAQDAENRSNLLELLCDGERLGLASEHDVLNALTLLRHHKSLSAVSPHLSILVVHALHGHSTEFIEGLYLSAKPIQSFFWIHDFFSICPGYTLLRNDVSFCNAPPLDAAGCAICVYGEERHAHSTRMRRLFDRVPFAVVAPSRCALDLWRKGANLKHATASVHEHCLITWRERDPPARPWKGCQGEPLRIAYLGFPTVHKGWPVFMDLCARLRRTSDHRFFHLGQRLEAEPQSLAELYTGGSLSGGPRCDDQSHRQRAH